MADLRERFDAADLIALDDVWPDVRDRLEGAGRLRAVAPAGTHRPRRDAWRKPLTIAAAFALAAAAIAVVTRAFLGASPTTPADEAPVIRIDLDRVE
jgi:hypothetical protein